VGIKDKNDIRKIENLTNFKAEGILPEFLKQETFDRRPTLIG
jgi:hypothetical protein